MPCSLEVGSASVPGSRHAYQDRILVNKEKRLFAVADGLTGPDFGDSAKAAELMLKLLDAYFVGDLKAGIEQANYEIVKIRRKEGIGETTIAAAYVPIGMDLAYIANVGDSPIYLFRQGSLTQLATLDTNGLYILQCIGKQSINVHISTINLLAGDVIFIASDGVEGAMKPEIISELLARYRSMDKVVKGIVKLAEKTSTDDKSIIGIRCRG